MRTADAGIANGRVETTTENRDKVWQEWKTYCRYFKVFLHDLRSTFESLIEGVAAGVILYVVFFEIFPKAKLIGGTGKQHIFAMVVGFLIFLPSIYFRKFHTNTL